MQYYKQWHTEHDNTCAYCGEDALLFSDQLSIREYEITGQCQDCQNKMYNTQHTHNMVEA